MDAVDDFLAKPFTGDELVRRIHRLMAQRSERTAAARE
jgi:DNA-binding response OmpR family regulator